MDLPVFSNAFGHCGISAEEQSFFEFGVVTYVVSGWLWVAFALRADTQIHCVMPRVLNLRKG